MPVDLEVDAGGNVYILCLATLPLSPNAQEFHTVKFSPAGQQQWVARYTEPGNKVASALALDNAGNAYITGELAGDYLTVRYNAAGQQQWAARYDSGSADTPTDIAVDATGTTVAVTGSSGTDYATVKYTPTGQQQWVARYDSGGSDVPTKVAVTATGSAIVVTGTSANDYATVQYGPNGQQQWVARYDGNSKGIDRAAELVLDAGGNVYVAGSSQSTTGYDFATLSYSPTGQQRWEARYRNTLNISSAAFALDAAGNTYVTGQGPSAIGKTEAVTLKFDTSGQPQWVGRFNNTAVQQYVGDAAGVAIAVDAQGNVAIVANATDYASRTSVVAISYGRPLTTGCDPLATEPNVPNQQLATAVGAPLTFTAASLLNGATDPLGRTLQVASIAKPSTGTLVKNADGSYTYPPQAGYTGPVTLSYVVQEAGPVLASPQTRHYYEFVSAPGISWLAAKATAAARSYRGLQGYLATITYQGEQDFLSGRQNGQYWLGASDETTEGEWRWTTGPEAGTLIWRGTASGYGTAYTNWQPGQPDDYKNQYRPQGEDYSLFYGQSGYWNDVDVNATGTSVAGYLVEYGGLESCTPVLYTLGTLTIQVGNTSAAMTARMTAMGSAALATAAQGTGLELEAMPNPSHGQFRVRLTATQDGPAQLELFDVQGRRVRALFSGNLAAGETRELAVDDASLATGLYQLRLQSAEGTRNLRLSVQP